MWIMNQVWVDQHKNAFLNAICGMQPMLGFTSLHCCTVLLAFNIRYGTRRTRISNKWTVPHSNRTQIKVFLLICFFPKEWNQLILINLLFFSLCMCLCEYVFACIFKLILLPLYPSILPLRIEFHLQRSVSIVFDLKCFLSKCLSNYEVLNDSWLLSVLMLFAGRY